MDTRNVLTFSDAIKALPAVAWQLLFFYVPVFFIVIMSLFDGSSFCIDAYCSIMKKVYFFIIVRSLWLAFLSTLMCLIIGYPIAYYLAFKSVRLKKIGFFLLVIPFWTNLLVLAYAWFFLLDKDGLINSLLLNFHVIQQPLVILNTWWAVLLVNCYCYLPFAVLPLLTTLEKFDHTLIEASQDLGASGPQTFFNIILPMSYYAIKTSIFVVFIPCFGEFAIPHLLGGDKYMYVGSAISHFFLVANQQSQGSAFTVLSCIVVLLALLSIQGGMYLYKRNWNAL